MNEALKAFEFKTEGEGIAYRLTKFRYEKLTDF
jgi:hypothetical protein